MENDSHNLLSVHLSDGPPKRPLDRATAAGAWPLRPSGDGIPPEISEDIYYLGTHGGRHVLAIYPYLCPGEVELDVDAWEASQQKVVIPAPLCRRSWRIAYGLAKRIRAWGGSYYKRMATARKLAAVAAEQGAWS